MVNLKGIYTIDVNTSRFVDPAKARIIKESRLDESSVKGDEVYLINDSPLNTKCSSKVPNYNYCYVYLHHYGDHFFNHNNNPESRDK
jgi:hypothetical protein